jgi:hypothetical protein
MPVFTPLLLEAKTLIRLLTPPLEALRTSASYSSSLDSKK